MYTTLSLYRHLETHLLSTVDAKGTRSDQTTLRLISLFRHYRSEPPRINIIKCVGVLWLITVYQVMTCDTLLRPPNDLIDYWLIIHWGNEIHYRIFAIDHRTLYNTLPLYRHLETHLLTTVDAKGTRLDQTTLRLISLFRHYRSEPP
ncbi:U2 [Hyposoter didymator ichnovirus]|nr:U2 [Hyposoter didymator ichnovirus]